MFNVKEIENKSRVQPTTTVESACNYLSTLYGRIRFLNLYQKLFPVEYAASTASTTRPENRFSDKEEEFLKLIDARMFELPEVAYDPNFTNTGTILINLMGVQTSCECGSPHPENFTAYWQVAMIMTGWAEMPDVTELPEGWEEELNLLQYAGKPETETLQCLLDEEAGDELEEVGNWQDAPLRYFGRMVDVVCHMSGNIFYDVENNLAHNLIWCEEDINFLAEEWKRCQEIEKQLDELLVWWEKADVRAVKLLVKIWNKLGDEGEIDLLELPEAALDFDQYQELADG